MSLVPLSNVCNLISQSEVSTGLELRFKMEAAGLKLVLGLDDCCGFIVGRDTLIDNLTIINIKADTVQYVDMFLVDREVWEV